ALLSAMTHANIAAICSNYLAGNITRILISERSTPSQSLQGSMTKWILKAMIRLLYPRAEKIISVSLGVSRDLESLFGIPRDKLAVIYNPIDTKKIHCLMVSPVPHPWLTHKETPVILAVGRL